ncbi:MAG: sigma-54 dependent transcriptional regulator [Pseudomonadales bacterium]|nr:sigma-54 dependent transcriptional regulator [Pseudomonadales bacterium]
MAAQKAKLLIVDDDQDILVAAKYLLLRHYTDVVVCDRPEGIPKLMEQHNFDVILLDMNFHPGDSDGGAGFSWLAKILQIKPDSVVITITAHGSVEVAVEAMKRGATDYVAKPWDNQKLLATVSAAMQLSQSRNEAAQLRHNNRALREASTRNSDTILGNSPAIRQVMNLINRAGPTDANVLILGENGTGKELVAMEIHQQSKRKDNVFISVDMGAITESLFESELFGHVKGAFTGAKDNRVGYLEAANSGSLFLDEVGNLPLHLQAKLLSVLEKREVSPVGATTSSAIDVRVIAATNMPLERLKDPRYFRQDLLFRLNTVEISLPALRERAEDISTIARHFVELYCRKYDKVLKQLSPSAIEALVHYRWPGNVRALRHAIERAVILSTSDTLEPKDFQFDQEYPGYKVETEKALDGDALLPNTADIGEQNLNLKQVEYRTIVLALKKHDYNISQTARELGLTRAALYRRMEKYGI